MSSKSKLSTLLQYRFVKKPREKISVEGRDNEKTNTDESDNSQESQNGSGIHTVTDNNVDIPTISLKYEDSCTSTPTVNGNDLARNIFQSCRKSSDLSDRRTKID